MIVPSARYSAIYRHTPDELSRRQMVKNGTAFGPLGSGFLMRIIPNVMPRSPLDATRTRSAFHSTSLHLDDKGTFRSRPPAIGGHAPSFGAFFTQYARYLRGTFAPSLFTTVR